jgi:amino-acid N-acetyltransferase
MTAPTIPGGGRIRENGAMSAEPGGFSEREFYLREFRGRTLLVVHPGGDAETLLPVLDVLFRDRARVVVASPSDAVLDSLSAKPVLDPADPRLEGEAWRALSAAPRVGVRLPLDAMAPAVRTVAVRLGVFKLVWLDPGGGLVTREGDRQSFVHGEELAGWTADPTAHLQSLERLDLWTDVASMLDAGVPAVNVCSADGLDAELFTYAGVGTLFTRDRYIHVRRLTLDDFDAAADLIARGVDEGYLAPRSQAQTDQVLAGGFGAFVEERHLAGMGSLLPLGETAGEVSALYTLTRFLGEGIGPHLVEFACQRALELGYDRVFACTTSDRVSAFFGRNGFEPVGTEALPLEKWADYDAERLARVQCHRRLIG